MSTESLTNSASHASSSTSQHTRHSQLSDSIQNDLTATQLTKTIAAAPTKAGNEQRQAATTVATAPTTPAPSQQQSSPTKSTPTKSKNKRRNDAKKRSANTKKQQMAISATAGSAPPIQQESQQQGSMVTLIPLNDCSNELNMSATGELQQEQQQEQAQTQIPSETARKHDTSLSPSTREIKSQEQESSEPSEHHEQKSASSSSPVQAHEDRQVSDKSPSTMKSNQLEVKKDNERSIVKADDPGNTVNSNRNSHDTNSWRRKQRENRELREQIKLRDAQLQNITERVKQQINKIKELEASLVSTTRTCGQFEKLLQQELTNRTRLEAENDSLNANLIRLKNQISSHEKDKSANNELIRVLNATLMERETEVSILKLKMTRLQTNSSINLQNNRTSNLSLTKPDPCKAYTMAGRSNSEFSRNSYARSTMVAEAISTRSSTSQSQSNDRDASVWATVPEELTPSKRPLLLERNLTAVYDQGIYTKETPSIRNQSSTPLVRDRRYRTLPRSMKSPTQFEEALAIETNNSGEVKIDSIQQPVHCLVTNLDESNNTSHSSGNRSSDATNKQDSVMRGRVPIDGITSSTNPNDADNFSGNIPIHTNIENNFTSHYSTIGNTKSSTDIQSGPSSDAITRPPSLPSRSPSTPVKMSFGLKKIFNKFKRSDSSAESKSRTDLSVTDMPATPTAPTFQRGSTRSTLVGPPSNFMAQMSPRKTIDFQTDKPFAEWDTNMLVDWLTMIGLSMYANQCRRWVKCGAHIMNATPAEVDKGLGITNHLHRKKLRLAISELNGDCDKITKAAAKLDYLWVARWLDDIGLPQYKEAFINARVDGRVLNYLTIEDLVSLGIKSLLHHSSIKCGIRVLRSINFDLQLLKRRATAEEIEQMSSMRQTIEDQTDCSNDTSGTTASSQQVAATDSETEVPLWTCHRVMEWLRMIDFAEFAPNLRGSGVHGGLIMYEDAFNVDTMSALLSIPSNRTLLRRHLSTFFRNLVGEELAQRKLQHKDLSSSQQLNPSAEIKTPRKSPLWFSKLKSSKVGQDGMDEYLCPMYPVEPQMIKSPTKKLEPSRRDGSSLPRIPESVNV